MLVSSLERKNADRREKNRLSARAARYARVGANVGGVAARYAGRRLLGGAPNRAGEAAALSGALGRLKGPLMKVAQLMATIPDLLPPEYATELQKLQSEAPPMGWAFVKRRMMAELGAGWETKFANFEHQPSAAASLGQVHRARSLDGHELACKLQYPDMQSAVEADLQQLQWLLAIRRRFDSAIDTTEVGKEIGERVREELDYYREAKHAALYRLMLDGAETVRVPRPWPELSTGRLLTLDWLDGTRMLAHKDDPLETRNVLATAMFRRGGFLSAGSVSSTATRISATTRFSARPRRGRHQPARFGCVRSFRRASSGRHRPVSGLLRGTTNSPSHAYETRGFAGCREKWSKCSTSGRASSTSRCWTTAAAPSPTASQQGEYGAAKNSAVQKALKQGSGGSAARIRLHGPRRDRAWARCLSS